MTSTDSAAEIAGQFRESLGDLNTNNKYEIVNLTGIAKDSVEHAQAIAKVLEDHIRTTQPFKKLPALYLLDSIAKNIGSPYTVYFSRNLFATFMEAYRMVDVQTRAAMEGMLKTWREPVPNSTDLKPVFNVEVVKNIQNALMKARAAAAQGQPPPQPMHAMPARSAIPGGPPQQQHQPLQQWRNSPTPQFDHRYGPPPQNPNAYAQPPFQQAYPPPQQQQFYPQGFFPPQQQQQYQQQPQVQTYYQQPPQQYQSQDDALISDLENLVHNARDDFARSPYDVATQSKLKALLDLEKIVKTQVLPPEQKQAVMTQVNALKAADQQRAQTGSAPPIPPTPQMQYHQPATVPPPPQPASAGNSLAELLRQAQARTSTPPQPQLQAPPPNIASIASALGNAPAAATDAAKADNALLASLRAAGLLPSETPQPIRPGSASILGLPFAPPAALSSGATPTLGSVSLMPPTSSATKNDVQLTTQSLRIPRPGLIRTLFTTHPNQCSTCGRRFDSSADGRARKARHLDFHFRTNQRLADAARRGVHRAWFMTELDWLAFREIDDGDEAPAVLADGEAAAGSAAASSDKKHPARQRYIKAPAGPLAALPCSICQEKFETVWLDDAQDWVWMDAVQVGGKIYHASCYDEASRSALPRAKSPGAASVLGKRKAEFQHGDDAASKLKREVVA